MAVSGESESKGVSTGWAVGIGVAGLAVGIIGTGCFYEFVVLPEAVGAGADKKPAAGTAAK